MPMIENTVNSFTFYKEYYDLITLLNEKEQMELLLAINRYMFENIEPTLNDKQAKIFNNLKRPLNKSKSRSQNGSNLTSNENQNEIKTKSKRNQNEIEINNKTKTHQDVNVNVNVIVNGNVYLSNNKVLKDKVLEWLEYKKQKNKNYTEIGLKTLLKQVEEKSKTYGVDRIINLIDECMASNYQGIIFERLNRPERKKSTTERLKELLEEEKQKNEQTTSN